MLHLNKLECYIYKYLQINCSSLKNIFLILFYLGVMCTVIIYLRVTSRHKNQRKQKFVIKILTPNFNQFSIKYNNNNNIFVYLSIQSYYYYYSAFWNFLMFFYFFQRNTSARYTCLSRISYSILHSYTWFRPRVLFSTK